MYVHFFHYHDNDYIDYFSDLDPRFKDIIFKDGDIVDIDAEGIMNTVVSMLTILHLHILIPFFL